MQKTAIIIGAGPAGLAAALELSNKTDIKPIILESYDCVGGISRTIDHNGNKFEPGPHRLFSKSSEVIDLITELLPMQGSPSVDDKLAKRKIPFEEGGPDPETSKDVMLKRNRLSRIYYCNKFFDYPLSINIPTILNLGILKTFRCGMSYIKSSFVKREENNLEDFYINRFGKVLYSMFFEKYTEKVWGRHPSRISKDWGTQRVKGLSLLKAVLSAILSPFKLALPGKKETSLIDSYMFPKEGCSQLWNKMAEKVKENGGEIYLNHTAVCFKKHDDKIQSVFAKTADGETKEFECDYVISSMPVKELMEGMNDVPDEIKNIASGLPYRDYIIVCFAVNKFNLKNNTKIKTVNNICPDSWIYLQDTGLTSGRMFIPQNFSPYMVKDFKNKVFFGMEFWANEGDEMWNKSEDELTEIAIQDILKLKITERENIEDKCVLKEKKVYPAYFDTYKDFDKVKKYIDTIDNLYCIGRNGQHKYNNMDHSILSGIEVAKIIKNGSDKSRIWDVNTEEEYHEIKK